MAAIDEQKWSARRAGLGVVMVFALALAACGASATVGATPTPGATASPVVSSTPTSGLTGAIVKVYFSKSPDSENHLSAVFPVNRFAPTRQVETFAVQLLLAGPTPEERATGYYSELSGLLNGPSLCRAVGPVGGPDFTLALNTKGPTPEPGTATLTFCRATLSPGEGTDARVLAELRATLLQFSAIKKVAILTTQGHCFGDLSGQDRCLQQ